MHEFFSENLRNPARIHRAGLMRQFRPIKFTVHCAQRARARKVRFISI
jgi:hypothetical protein